MKEIAIYGAGGFGCEVAAMIDKINAYRNNADDRWELIGFFDDNREPGTRILGFGDVIGGINSLNSFSRPLAIVMAIGSPVKLKKVRDKITNPLVNFPNIIDPTFSIADERTFSIGVGNIIRGGSAVTTNVGIGNFNILNGHVIIGHDVRIGDFNLFMPGVYISGEARIGDLNLFGASSFVKQQLKVGTGVTLSPLSALLTKPKDNSVYIGNPAKIFKF